MSRIGKKPIPMPKGVTVKITPDANLTLTPFGNAIGFLPILDMSSHHTLQRTSPPTPAFTAARPVMTPRDVVRMLVPSPASTSGTSSLPK